MIYSVKVIFCENEHGSGEQTFPRIDDITDLTFINPVSAARLRADAKKAGWIRFNGADYCDLCAESVRGNG